MRPPVGESRDGLDPARLFFDPFAEAGGVPVVDDAKERAEHQHDEPVAVKWIFDRGARHVIEMTRAATETQPDGFEAISEKAKDFSEAKFTDVRGGGRELGVDVENVDPVVARAKAFEH